jgi:hypothetical protein
MLLGGWRSFPMVLRYAHFAPDHLALAAAKVRLKRRTKTAAQKGSPENPAHNPLILVVREGLFALRAHPCGAVGETADVQRARTVALSNPDFFVCRGFELGSSDNG